MDDEDLSIFAIEDLERLHRQALEARRVIWASVAHLPRHEISASRLLHLEELMARAAAYQAEIQARRQREISPTPPPAATKPGGSERRKRVYYCCAAQDGELRRELERHLDPLKRAGRLEDWGVDRIGAGLSRQAQIEEHLRRADLILTLVSPDLLAPEPELNQEIDQALRQQQEGRSRVIPILVRPAQLRDGPFMGMEPLPKNGKPVVKWRFRDEAWLEIAAYIAEVI